MASTPEPTSPLQSSAMATPSITPRTPNPYATTIATNKAKAAERERVATSQSPMIKKRPTRTPGDIATRDEYKDETYAFSLNARIQIPVQKEFDVGGESRGDMDVDPGYGKLMFASGSFYTAKTPRTLSINCDFHIDLLSDSGKITSDHPVYFDYFPNMKCMRISSKQQFPSSKPALEFRWPANFDTFDTVDHTESATFEVVRLTGKASVCLSSRFLGFSPFIQLSGNNQFTLDSAKDPSNNETRAAGGHMDALLCLEIETMNDSIVTLRDVSAVRMVLVARDSAKIMAGTHGPLCSTQIHGTTCDKAMLSIRANGVSYAFLSLCDESHGEVSIANIPQLTASAEERLSGCPQSLTYRVDGHSRLDLHINKNAIVDGKTIDVGIVRTSRKF